MNNVFARKNKEWIFAVEEAFTDGELYARKDMAWEKIVIPDPKLYND
jgi:hypothetical protein